MMASPAASVGEAVEIVEQAIAELDAGQPEAARACLKAFVAATRATEGRGPSGAG